MKMLTKTLMLSALLGMASFNQVDAALKFPPVSVPCFTLALYIWAAWNLLKLGILTMALSVLDLVQGNLLARVLEEAIIAR